MLKPVISLRLFSNQAHASYRPTYACFLEIVLVRTVVCVCVSVCVFALRTLINSGMFWCDIARQCMIGYTSFMAFSTFQLLM